VHVNCSDVRALPIVKEGPGGHLPSAQSHAPRIGRTDEFGGPLRYSNWRRRIWLPAAKAAGCEGAGFHDLRRLNATTLVTGGIDVKTAQTRLGHADPRMTLAIYASAPASIEKAAADVIGESFFGQKSKKTARTRSPRHFRAIASDEPGASES
jgi:integrase